MEHRRENVYENNMPPVLPNTPVSFEDSVNVDHLPNGWKYQLEVIEARYVQ